MALLGANGQPIDKQTTAPQQGRVGENLPSVVSFAFIAGIDEDHEVFWTESDQPERLRVRRKPTPDDLIGIAHILSDSVRGREHFGDQIEAKTAFLVFQLPEGRVAATDTLLPGFSTSWQPSSDEIQAAAVNVYTELSARKAADLAAATTVQTMMAVQRQIAEAQQNQQILQGL